MEKLQKWTPYENLISHDLPDVILTLGSIYFIFTIIGNVILFFSTATIEEMPSFTFMSQLFFSIFTGLIVLIVCWGINRILKQNIFLIRRYLQEQKQAVEGKLKAV